MGSDSVWAMGSDGVVRSREQDERARIEDGCLVAETDPANLPGCAVWVPLAAVADLLRSAGFSVADPSGAAPDVQDMRFQFRGDEWRHGEAGFGVEVSAPVIVGKLRAAGYTITEPKEAA